MSWFSCSGGTDSGDHPPITPLKNASRDQLKDTEWRLYEFVVRHFIATVSASMVGIIGCANCL